MDGVGSVVAHNLDANPRTEDVRLKELAPFSKMLLKEAVRKGLAQTGFVYPTVIQATAIPVGKSGLDLLVQSKSGTGKTLIFATIVLEAYRADVPEPQSLVVAPTREIAVQIESVLNQIGRFAAGFRACSVIGGLDVADDRRRLQGARAVVGTPGRLLHLIQNEVLNTAHMRLLVLDEADKMYTASFRHDLQRIERALPSRRQTIACSATFCDDLDKELARIMRQPLLISTEQRATLLLGIKQFAYELPEQKTSILEMQSKLAALRVIFGRIPFKQCVIFAGSQSRADSYRTYLEREGWPCELMSGAQDQRTRLEQFKKFREFRTRILVATDLMSRGIDSDHVNLVINLELPGDMVTYLHRIGRAGRFGSHGIAISFVASEKDRGLLRRLISKVGAGMNVLKFPTTEIEGEKMAEDCERKHKEKTLKANYVKPERDLWDFSDAAADQRHFGLFGQELIAPLASQDHVSSPSQEDAVSSPNKENYTNNIGTAAGAAPSQQQTNSSSIDTKTFGIDSKDSAFNMLDLLVDRPDAYKQHNLTSDSRHSSTQQLPSSTSNTIDDASSIAADSLRSSQQDVSRYQSVLMQKAAIPTLVEFLVDKSSLTTPLSVGEGSDAAPAKAALPSKKKEKTKKKPQIDFFDDYKQTVQLDSTEENKEADESLNQSEDKTGVSLMAKLANFKSLLIDKPELTTKAAAKQKDIYSDYANFNAADDEEEVEDNEVSTSISQPTTTATATEEATTAATTEEDFDKATFILSVATPSIVRGGEESIEELQNSSLDLSREANDDENDDQDENTSELPSLPEKQHFPSPAHNQPPPLGTSSIPDVVPPTLQMIIPTASRKVIKLTVNVGAQIEIPPYLPHQVLPAAGAAAESPNLSDDDGDVDVDGDGETNSETEEVEEVEESTESSINTVGGSSADGEVEGGVGSSGFDEATTTSGSSGIETSEVEHEGLCDVESYQTSPEISERDDYICNYYSDSDDDSTEDMLAEPEPAAGAKTVAGAMHKNAAKTASAAAGAARSVYNAVRMARPNQYDGVSTNLRWVDMYWHQVIMIEDYVTCQQISLKKQPPSDADADDHDDYNDYNYVN